MRRHQFEPARAHFEKAAKLAPSNPDVQYLMGMLKYTWQHVDAARTKFENAISLYRNHERALVALGELQLRTGQPAQAAQTLPSPRRLPNSHASAGDSPLGAARR